MKTLHYISFTSLIALLVACGPKDQVAELKAKIKEKKDQTAALRAEITTLEAELKKAGGDSANNKAKVKLVAIKDIAAKPFSHYIEIQGKIDSDKNVTIAPKTAGTITRIYVHRGDYVRAGSVLAIIEDDMVRKGMDQLQVNLDLATTAYNKQKALWDQKIGTEIQYLQAKTQKESLERQMDQMKEQQDMTRIKATIDGTVDEIFPKEGELAVPGMPAFRIVNTSNLKVRAEVAEGYVGKIKKGDKVILHFPDINENRDSYITNVGDVISSASRTFPVEAQLIGNSRNFKANMITYLKIQDYKSAKALVVPLNVIQRDADGTYVFLAINGAAKKTYVKVGKIYKTDAEILEGVKEGDKLITIGYQDLVDAQRIKF